MAQETQTDQTLLIFRVGRIPCAVPALSMDGIAMPPARITATPGADRANPGLFVHGTEAVAMVDLREKFGLGDVARGPGGRILRARLAGRPYGFWVDEVVTIAEETQGQRLPLPPDLPHDTFRSAFLYRNELVLCTDFPRLYAMGDAAPLRRYQASLEAAARRSEEKTRAREQAPPPSERTVPSASPQPARPAAVGPPRPAHAGGGCPEALPKRNAGEGVPSAPHRHHDRPGTQPPAAATGGRPVVPVKAKRPTPAAATNTRQTPTVGVAKAPRRGSASTGDSAAAPRTPPRPPHRSQPENPSPPPAPPAPPIRASETPATSPWPTVLLLLGALVFLAVPAWWFLTPPPRQAARPVPDATVAFTPDEAPQPPDGEAEYPPPSTAQAPGPAAGAGQPIAQASTTGVSEPSPAASLQVERDIEGITLIIEGASPREGLAESETATTPPPDPPPAGEKPPIPVHTAQGQAPEAPPPPAGSTPPARQPRVFVHTVVRGDTLWAIAEHYIRNPWKYPELARQSGIHNPDLIYPGDKVRIVFR